MVIVALLVGSKGLVLEGVELICGINVVYVQGAWFCWDNWIEWTFSTYHPPFHWESDVLWCGVGEHFQDSNSTTNDVDCQSYFEHPVT